MSVELQASNISESLTIKSLTSQELAMTAMRESPQSTSNGPFNAAAAGVSKLEQVSYIDPTRIAPKTQSPATFNSSFGTRQEQITPLSIEELSIAITALAPQASRSGNFDSCSGNGRIKDQAPNTEAAAEVITSMQ